MQSRAFDAMLNAPALCRTRVFDIVHHDMLCEVPAAVVGLGGNPTTEMLLLGIKAWGSWHDAEYYASEFGHMNLVVFLDICTDHAFMCMLHTLFLHVTTMRLPSFITALLHQQLHHWGIALCDHSILHHNMQEYEAPFLDITRELDAAPRRVLSWIHKQC